MDNNYNKKPSGKRKLKPFRNLFLTSKGQSLNDFVLYRNQGAAGSSTNNFSIEYKKPPKKIKLRNSGVNRRNSNNNQINQPLTRIKNVPNSLVTTLGHMTLHRAAPSATSLNNKQNGKRSYA